VKRLACALALLAAISMAHAAPLSAARTTDMRDAVDRITIAAENSDYHLVKVQAIDTALVKRGYEDPGVRILFFGNAAAMARAEQEYPPLLSMLPIKMVLVVRGKDIVAISDDLDAWKEMFPEPAAHRLIDIWRHDIEQMLKDFATN
jgi:hypothetical protein